MTWDPTQPPTNSPVVSAPIRQNFQALDGFLMQPLTSTPSRLPVPILDFYTFAGNIPLPPADHIYMAMEDATSSVGYPNLVIKGPSGAAWRLFGQTAPSRGMILFNPDGTQSLSIVHTGADAFFGTDEAVRTHLYTNKLDVLVLRPDGATEFNTGPLFLKQLDVSPASQGTYTALYSKSDRKLYMKDDAGVETALGAPGLTNPMTGLGDLIRGGASGDPTRLAPGSNGQFLSLAGGLPTWAPVPAGFVNPMTTLGDVITGGASGVAGRLGIGSATQVLTVVGGVPAWAAPAMVNPMTTAADLLVGGASGTPTRLGVGANTQVLTVVGGALAWQAPVSGGMTNPMSALGDLITGGASGVANRLAIGATSQVLTVVGGVPTWQAPVSGGMTNPMSAPGDLIIGAAAGSPIRLAASTNGFVLTLTAGSPAWAANAAMLNPMTAVGDLIRGGASGAPTRLGVGSNGQWLTLAAGVPAWASLPVDPGFANPMSTLGDIIQGGASGAPGRLGIGSAGQILTVAGGVPTWAANAAMSNPMSNVGDLIRGGAAGVPTRLGAVATGQVLASAGVNTAPVWSASPTLAGLTLSGLAVNSVPFVGAGGVLMADAGFTFTQGTPNVWYMPGTANLGLINGTSLTLFPAAGVTALTLSKTASGQQAMITGQTAGVTRWTMALGDSAAESGANAGSNLAIYANTDAGAFLSTPVSLVRSDVTNPVQLLLGGLYRQLTLGAPDSGGAGFRMVRVPN